MPRVLIAPQEFKGSLTAVEAADAIAVGIASVQPGWELDVLPMSDGGPGFVAAMHAALGGSLRSVGVHDALMRPVEAEWLWVEQQRMAVIESAAANGLTLIAPGQRDALRADSFGVGELLRAAAEAGAAAIVIGVGGSATTDGGHGMARALGGRFYDGAGRQLPPGGASLAELQRIEWRLPHELEGVDVLVATDVTNPLIGAGGAAAVYGPQKGASPADVDALEAALLRYAAVLRRALGVDIAAMPGAGAAGGLAAGLVAFLGGRIESGFEIVARVSGLEARIAAADFVVTGEGSFDGQSLQGKTTGRLLGLAWERGRAAVVFAGRSMDSGANVRTLASIEPDPGRSMANAAGLLERLAAEWAMSPT